jgi:hypothetical protein
MSFGGMSFGGMSLGDMRLGDMSFGALTSVDTRLIAMLLTAAAVLLWPAAHSALVPSGVPGLPDQAGSAAATDEHSIQPGKANGASTRTVVPVAEIAGVVDLLALTLRAGVGVVEAMEAVAARVGGLPGMHLRSVAAAGRWGVDDATAWSTVPTAWGPAAMALRMAAAAGVPPADALRGAAQEIRRAEQQRLEMATATLSVRIVLPLGLLFLPAFILTTVLPIVIALARQLLVSP